MRSIAALMIQCSNAGVAWYRLTSWSTAAHRLKVFNVLQPWWNKEETGVHPWQVDVDDAQFRRRILSELNDHAQKANIVVSQMVHTKAALITLEGIKAMYGLPLITEIDDNILSTPTYNPANALYQQGSQFRALAIEQFRMSDAMIVSTPYLKEVYAEYCENIFVIPNSLDFRIWENLKQRKNTDFIRIGWAGGASHDDDLKIIEPVVHKILAAYPNVRFCLVHGIPDFLRNIDRVEEVQQFARIDRYPQFLASRNFDIGIAPLVDNSFNRGKSNLRWLEYAGLRVPCVASKVGHFAETLVHMEDAVLCDSEAEWVQALSWLIEDETARRKIGKNANQRARRDFNVESMIHKYADVLFEVRERGQTVKIPEILPGSLPEVSLENMGATA